MIRFLCVLCVLCGSSFSSFGLDRHAFTFTSYDLNANIEPEQQRLAVRGKITLRNDSDAPQKNLSLQISSTLNWLSIQFEGKPVEFVSQPYTSDTDHTGALTEAIVVLPRAVAPKQSAELEVGYEGVIPQDATRQTRIGVPADLAKHSDWDEISAAFTAVRGIGYVAWYPIATEAVSLSEGNSVFEEVGRWKQREAQSEMQVNVCETKPAAMALMNDINFRVPAMSVSGVGGERGVVCREHDYPQMGDIVPIFAIADFGQLDDSNAIIHYLPPHKSAADDYALAIEQVSPLVGKWFGDHREKSDNKAEVVELPDPNAAPFESGNMLLIPLTADETTLLLSAVRQSAHLYFPSPREWIREGLASYAQTNYLEEEKGRAAALIYLQSHRSALIEAEKQNLALRSNSADNSLINAPDEFYVQAKAMNVWWMLRDIVGEDAFTAALHNYKPGDDTDEHYMQKLMEAQAHRDLGWFFEDWVYHDRGLPHLHIVSVYPRQMENGSYMTTVEIENSGGAGAEIPVTAHMDKGDSTVRLIVTGKSKASVRIVTPAVPQEITVNDGSVPDTETSIHSYKIERSRR